MISLVYLGALFFCVVVWGDLSRRWRVGGLSLKRRVGQESKRVFQALCASLLASYGAPSQREPRLLHGEHSADRLYQLARQLLNMSLQRLHQAALQGIEVFQLASGRRLRGRRPGP